MASVPARVLERLVAGLKKYPKILASAKDRDINESDTVVIVNDFLSEVLGFDKYAEITREFSIRGTFCDLAVKVDGKVLYLIEVKAIGLPLKEGHLRQAISYASSNGVEWVALTNGSVWNVYRMRFEQPIRHDLVFSLDLLTASPKDEDVIERLFLLSKEGIAKSAIEAFHEQKEACNPFLISAVVLSEPVVSVIRRELRRISEGARIEEDELVSVLIESVLKRDVVEGEKARLAGAQAKRAAGRTLKKSTRIDAAEAKALVSTPRSELPVATETATPGGAKPQTAK